VTEPVAPAGDSGYSRAVTSHHDLIRDQFTRQAVPFSEAPGIRDEKALDLLVDATGLGPDDVALDVACGPGLVVCALARVVRHATGIDLTPAMLERARTLAAERGLDNVTWRQADVCPLPFADGEFSLVTSRFAVHHFPDPAAVVAEMARACRPGGRVAVIDVVVSDDPAKAAAFNRMERLRDPSHVRALRLDELRALFRAGALGEPRATSYRLESDLDGLLERSFPDPADVPEIRRLFVDSLADDGLGVGTWRKGERVRFAYPVAILVANR
jgi:SAM-dependent methyltransferase